MLQAEMNTVIHDANNSQIIAFDFRKYGDARITKVPPAGSAITRGFVIEGGSEEEPPYLRLAVVDFKSIEFCMCEEEPPHYAFMIRVTDKLGTRSRCVLWGAGAEDACAKCSRIAALVK